MAGNTTHKVDRKLVVPAVSSKYPTPGNAYSHGSYTVNYSPSLVRTGKDYYDSKTGIPEGLRMSTAGEELAIQLALEKAGKDPREAKIFADLFASGIDKIYMWQWTETGLRVPKGRKADAYETGSQGRKYWPRVVLLADKEVGEILVPEGSGRLVAEWDKVFGVPRVTIENKDFPHKPYTTHFHFNSNPGKDSKSGNNDVAVGRRSDWRHDEHDGCLDVDADYGRSDAGSIDGFRPVRGSIPEIQIVSSNVDIEQVRREILGKARAEFSDDLAKLPVKELVRKYQL